MVPGILSSAAPPVESSSSVLGIRRGDDSGWLSTDEMVVTFLSRSLFTRPPILLPRLLHRAPLCLGNVVEIAGPSGSGKSQLILMEFTRGWSSSALEKLDGHNSGGKLRVVTERTPPYPFGFGSDTIGTAMVAL